MTPQTLKSSFRAKIKVVPGGPPGIDGGTRGQGMLDALDALVDFADTSSAGPARLQIVSAQGQRVAVLAIESNAVQFSAVRLFDHAAALNFQVNTRVSGNWAPGAQQTLTQLNATIASLTPQQLSDGVEVEFETQVSGAVASQFVAQVTATGLSGFSTLPGTRAARRVFNPNASPEPAEGLLFNAPNRPNPSTYQALTIPNPALTEATVTFWAQLNEPVNASTDYWYFSARPANNVYLTLDSTQGLTYYSDGVGYNGIPLGMPTGQWKRITLLLTNLQAGQLTFFAPLAGNPIAAGIRNIKLYDVRVYSRHFTDLELAERTSAPGDSLLGRYTLPFDLDTSGTVNGMLTLPDESGNNNNATLYNF